MIFRHAADRLLSYHSPKQTWKQTKYGMFLSRAYTIQLTLCKLNLLLYATNIIVTIIYANTSHFPSPP